MGQEELEQMTEVYNMLVTYLVNYSFQIFGAVVVLILGVFVGRRLSNLVLALCAKKSLDITLSRFFASCRAHRSNHHILPCSSRCRSWGSRLRLSWPQLAPWAWEPA